VTQWRDLYYDAQNEKERGNELEDIQYTTDRHYRRFYVIGDIHGNYDDLCTLLAFFREDGFDSRVDALVQLGDMIDSFGKEEAAKVVKHLRRLHREIDCFVVRGNHEQLLIDAIDKDMSTIEFQMWWQQGGKNTFDSYVREDSTFDNLNWSKKLQVPDQLRSDIEWFKSLPTLVVADDYYFVHGGLDPVLIENTPFMDKMWIREEFLNSTKDFGKLVVHGHTSQTSPELRENRINVDTAKTGKVSGVRLEANKNPLFFDKYSKYELTSGVRQK